MTRRHFVSVLGGAAVLPLRAAKKPEVVLELPPGPGNPRNSEGDFIRLRDGRLLFAYSRFGGDGGDDAPATIEVRSSSDGGRSWTSKDETLVAGEGAQNVMSVSFVRLADGRIGLFYIRKNSRFDCQVLARFSTDEARTWSRPVLATPDAGYFVLNNDRVVQLSSGRIVVPVARHSSGADFTFRGVATCYLSDDGGRSWRRSRSVLECPDESSRAGLQEPGVVELNDGRLMMFMRTDLGSHYLSYSNDGGESWTAAQPSSLVSPLSPASIERIPKTGHLLAVWNDHSQATEEARNKQQRTPLTVAISEDEGRTWIRRWNIENSPEGTYCYTAIEMVDDHVLLAYTAADQVSKLRAFRVRMVRIPIAVLYGDG
ncbi:MAG: sialidase family protein [Bryobacterales bacterium]|nr:glycoside hydrolase [Bryobacteraceae bacterium]MDW8355089.1 sialidase family protein [Bryobacterales bacterium]